ncbi:MAG: hypothetical protein ACLTDC_04580 [Lachnospiraceae bacterium]
MPHINRVRVNNVRYNFGTQFYDDFIMRFDCKNVLYDLANGGGKSVLLLLLLQNLIPNCTLDDKQPVEKLFRGEGGSTVIHSLIEWKLDDYLVKDDYRYMLTGFCARKAKDDENQNAAGTVAAIEYFNMPFLRHMTMTTISRIFRSATVRKELHGRGLKITSEIFQERITNCRFIYLSAKVNTSVLSAGMDCMRASGKLSVGSIRRKVMCGLILKVIIGQPARWWRIF